MRFSVAIFRCELNQLAFFIDFIRVFKKCVALFIVLLFGPLFWVSAGHSPQSMVQSVHLLGVATLQQFLIINFEALPFNKKKKSELKHQQQQPLPILIVNALPECDLAHQHSNGM